MDRRRIMAKRIRRAPLDDTPFVLTRQGTHGEIIHAVNGSAQALGMHKDARLVDMRALCPDLRAEPADITGDRVALEKLIFWARRWCPWSAIDGEDGFVLDTTGADHLFGGEAAMLADIETRLAHAGLQVRLAIAPTWGAAWALARHDGKEHAICMQGGTEAMLAPLPVRAPPPAFHCLARSLACSTLERGSHALSHLRRSLTSPSCVCSTLHAAGGLTVARAAAGRPRSRPALRYVRAIHTSYTLHALHAMHALCAQRASIIRATSGPSGRHRRALMPRRLALRHARITSLAISLSIHPGV